MAGLSASAAAKKVPALTKAQLDRFAYLTLFYQYKTRLVTGNYVEFRTQFPTFNDYYEFYGKTLAVFVVQLVSNQKKYFPVWKTDRATGKQTRLNSQIKLQGQGVFNPIGNPAPASAGQAKLANGELLAGTGNIADIAKKLDAKLINYYQRSGDVKDHFLFLNTRPTLRNLANDYSVDHQRAYLEVRGIFNDKQLKEIEKKAKAYLDSLPKDNGGFFSNPIKSLTKTIAKVLDTGTDVLTSTAKSVVTVAVAPVKITATAIQGGDVAKEVKAAIGGQLGIVTAAGLQEVDPIKDLLENKNVEKITLGISENLAGAQQLSKELQEDKPLDWEKVQDTVQLGVKAAVIATGAAVAQGGLTAGEIGSGVVSVASGVKAAAATVAGGLSLAATVKNIVEGKDENIAQETGQQIGNDSGHAVPSQKTVSNSAKAIIAIAGGSLLALLFVS